MKKKLAENCYYEGERRQRVYKYVIYQRHSKVYSEKG